MLKALDEHSIRQLLRAALRDPRGLDDQLSIEEPALEKIATLASGNVMLGFAAILLGAVCAILRRCTGGVVAPICTHVVWSTIVLFALPPIFG